MTGIRYVVYATATELSERLFCKVDMNHYDRAVKRYCPEGVRYDRLLDEIYSGKVLARTLLRKLRRKLVGDPRRFEPVANYNGMVVFDRVGLHGAGLWLGDRFCPVLLELGLKRCERIFELCAGPGYLGYWLFAHGSCEKLTLVDVNPAAVEAAELTAAYNGIAGLVAIYKSDGLDSVPQSDDKWDVVVGNPPHFLPQTNHDANLLLFDRDWRLHRSFYASVKRFIKPGGYVVMIENQKGSTGALFAPMIEAGGGEMVATRPGTTICPEDKDFYYVISKW